MRKRLACWKRQYISNGGRLTLMKNVVSDHPIYMMSLFRMLKLVARRLEAIQREFLLGVDADQRSPHLVHWENCCRIKSEGGLRIRSLSVLNQALMCKWYWRFTQEQQAL